jgi:hypothetical protein
MPINSFPPVILMYSLYHFSPQGGYHLVTLKLRRLALRRTGQNLTNLGYYPITNRLRHVTLVTYHSSLDTCHSSFARIHHVR